MGEFLSYSLVSGFLLSILFLAYRFVLAGDRQPDYNRWVLLSIYLISFSALPLAGLYQLLFAHSSPAIMNGFNITGQLAEPTQESNWIRILMWIFLGGIVAVGVMTIATWIRLIKLIRSGEKVSKGHFTLVLIDDESIAPFSWMRYIVIGREEYEKGCSAVVTHEMSHVSCRHWIDLLMAQMVCIINWFNPATWQMRNELMLIHEYQADMAVIESGVTPREYQRLLIKKAAGTRFPSLANSLNHSKLKKRITMMYKKKSGARQKLKAVALVPIFALAFSVTGIPSVRAAVSVLNSASLSVSKDNKNLSNGKVNAGNLRISDFNNYDNETTIIIKGENMGNNLTVSGGTFTTAGKSYQAKSMQCNMTDGNANIKLVFPFTSVYENSSLTLTVNGEEVAFDMEGFFNKAMTITLGEENGLEKPGAPSGESSLGFNLKSSSLPENMSYYLDGKKISSEELYAIPPEKITSITIDKQTNSIKMETK